MDVLLSLEGEYILSTRLGGQDASLRDKVDEDYKSQTTKYKYPKYISNRWNTSTD